MSLLVTGAGGFVGLNVVEILLAAGHHVVAVSNTPILAAAQLRFDRLPGRLTTVLADVRDAAVIEDTLVRFGVTQVLHGAAVTVPGSATTAESPLALSAADVNVGGTRVVLEACRSSGKIERFVYPSSSAVYGNAVYGPGPLTEREAADPVGLYGKTKLAAESVIAEARAEDGLPAVIARVTAVFGPWEHDTGARRTLSPPWQLAARARRQRSAILATGGARDWTHSREVALALVALLTGPLPPGEIYNVGLGVAWHLELLARALTEHYPGFGWRIGPDEETDLEYADALPRVRVPLDASRLQRDLGMTFSSPVSAAADYAAWTALGAV